MALLLFYGLGNILGAGIYVLIGEMSNISGMYAPISFIVALIVVSFTAFSYAELVSRYPTAAGGAIYVKKGFGSTKLSVLVGMMIALAGLISAATIIKGFTGYMVEIVEIPQFLAIAGLVLILGAIAIWGVGESVAIASFITLIEISGLLIIIWVGLPSFETIPDRVPELIPPLSWEPWSLIFLSGFLAFFAFTGFEDMVNLAEEVKEPEKSFPKAIFLSLIIAAVLYILVALVTVLMLTPAELANTDAPFAQIYKKATGGDTTVISLISILAIINGALIQMIMVSRILYGMSKERWLPGFLSYVWPKTKTPVTSTILVMAVILIFAAWLPIVSLANITSSFILIIFTVINLSLIRVKLSSPAPMGIINVPLWVPVAGVIINIIFTVMQFTG